MGNTGCLLWRPRPACTRPQRNRPGCGHASRGLLPHPTDDEGAERRLVALPLILLAQLSGAPTPPLVVPAKLFGDSPTPHGASEGVRWCVGSLIRAAARSAMP